MSALDLLIMTQKDSRLRKSNEKTQARRSPPFARPALAAPNAPRKAALIFAELFPLADHARKKLSCYVRFLRQEVTS